MPRLSLIAPTLPFTWFAVSLTMIHTMGDFRPSIILSHICWIVLSVIATWWAAKYSIDRLVRWPAVVAFPAVIVGVFAFCHLIIGSMKYTKTVEAAQMIVFLGMLGCCLLWLLIYIRVLIDDQRKAERAAQRSTILM